MTTDKNERRITKMARRSARIVLELEAEGYAEGARRFAAAAAEVADLMRAGKL